METLYCDLHIIHHMCIWSVCGVDGGWSMVGCGCGQCVRLMVGGPWSAVALGPNLRNILSIYSKIIMGLS